MQILLSCAKIMQTDHDADVPLLTEPRFVDDAHHFARELSGWSVEDFAKSLSCSAAIAAETRLRYQSFADASHNRAAVLSYYGQAYKYLRAWEFSAADFEFAQKHLHITSFLYGLLRPLDAIHLYRMEGNVRLRATGDKKLTDWWADRLTDVLIEAVKADDGTLIHLATEEMQHLFDWARVCREVKVVQPFFYTDEGSRLKVLAVHAKSCRGAMARKIITERLTDASQLNDFELLGYGFRPEFGDPAHPHFIKPKD